MLTLAQGSVPRGIFTHTVAFPGLATETMIGAVGLLLSACGVNHQIPFDPNTTTGITTGNESIDSANGYRYFDLKNKLIEFTREFTRVDCVAQIAGNGVRLEFHCY